MNVTEPDPGPDVFLLHHERRLRSLALSFRERRSRAAADPLREALRLHAAIEEQICFPSLLGSKALGAAEVVAAARKARGGLLEALERPDVARGAELAEQIDAYTAFEEDRLLPLFKVLPGVTLREMALEIQELLGPRGHARGA